ncbi:MAG: chemotaxis protein CheC [Desulfobacterales bacterium]|nr:chemotaxis protein CheC [Desulfobacterales bacterium]
MKPTDQQLEGLKELINIGVGQGASVLNTMLRSHIRLQVPTLKLLSAHEFKEELAEYGWKDVSLVNLGFKGNFSGSTQLIFPSDSASKLITTLTGEVEIDDLDSIRAGTFSEIGNVVLNGVMGSISNILKFHLNYNVPNYMEGGVDDLFSKTFKNPDNIMLLARTRFVVEALSIDGDILLFFDIEIFDKLLQEIDELANPDGSES